MGMKKKLCIFSVIYTFLNSTANKVIVSNVSRKKNIRNKERIYTTLTLFKRAEVIL